MKAILYVNSLLFTERKLTAMINEVKSPYPRAGGKACIFQLWKSYTVKEMCVCVLFLALILAQLSSQDQATF